MRRAVIDRKTNETQIQLKLTIEGRGRYAVSTGIRFLDHMLELFTRHGAFDLDVKATGDLDVDQHHTVEDLGIALGEAVSQALGDRRGINRAGYFVMPMDETLAVVALDLGGRPHAAVDLKVKVRLRRRPAGRARPRFLRGLRHRRARQRAREGAVRPVEPPPHRGGVQGVRARAARGVQQGQAAGEGVAEYEGTDLKDHGSRRFTATRIDGSHRSSRGSGFHGLRVHGDRSSRLRRGKSHLGAQGVRAPRARRSTRRSRRPICRGATAVVVPGVGHFSATRSLTPDWHDGRARGLVSRHAAARHLRRHAVAVRGQHRGAGVPWPRGVPGRCTRLTGGRRSTEGAARRVEHAAICQGLAAARGPGRRRAACTSRTRSPARSTTPRQRRPSTAASDSPRPSRTAW